jgi:hypothetical protein
VRLEADYDQHPAFRSYVDRARTKDSFGGLFDAIDQTIAAEAHDQRREGNAIAGIAADIRRLIDGDSNIAPSFVPFVAEAFDRAIKRHADEQDRRRRLGAARGAASAAARARADTLLEQGYSIFYMPSALVAQLREILTPDIDRLRQTFINLPDDIITCGPSNLASVDMVKRFCDQEGVFEAISAFYGEQYRALGFVIHVSHPNDSWYRQFDDIGLQMPLTSQMHFDLSFELPKAMLYLNDVGTEQGPFSVVQKAEPWERFGSELAFRKEILYSVADFMNKTHGITMQGNTSVFRHSAARAIFASLPKSLRQISHVGDHILDGTDLSRHLLTSETKLIGAAGMMPVFTGSHVLHRGGLVSNGERWALQIFFYPQAGIIRRVLRRLRRELASRVPGLFSS